MLYEQFVCFYKKYGKCINDPFKQKNALNEKQLKRKYEKYISKLSEGKSLDSIIAEKIWERDKEKCRLMILLTREELEELSLFYKDKMFFYKLDIAHIYPKSSHPHLRYELENMVLLYRNFHNSLDEQKNPLNGKNMTKEETLEWWKRIVNSEDIWNSLQRKKNEKDC